LAVFWIAGGKLADPKPRPGALRIEGSRITGKSAFAPPGATIKNAAGLTIVPAFIDAHVHLAVGGDPHTIAREQIRRGVIAVLDLGAPERLLPMRHPPLRIRFSGPLLTAPGGYPTASWGRNGEGLEVATADEARRAVQRLAAAEARFVKLALDARFPLLEPAVAAAAAAEGRRLGLLVAAHALEADSVRRALDAGADVLAHTPRDPLPDDLLARMRGKWVVSTLRAFAVAPERLRSLHQAGARVVYGTDLGNEGTAPGIDAGELALLEGAGVDPISAATSEAAALLGLRDVGRLTVGASASVLAVRSLRPQDLARPEWVMIDGRMVV
jgi:imidazolonepropionase-like amidohydrolase